MNLSGRHGRGESAYLGVARKAGSRKWRAQIQLHLGNYDSDQKAAAIFSRAERLFRAQALELRRTWDDLREE